MRVRVNMGPTTNTANEPQQPAWTVDIARPRRPSADTDTVAYQYQW